MSGDRASALAERRMEDIRVMASWLLPAPARQAQGHDDRPFWLCRVLGHRLRQAWGTVGRGRRATAVPGYVFCTRCGEEGP